MHSRLARTARSIYIERDSRHPGKRFPCKHQGPSVPFFSWYARVDKDVLQLASPATTGWPQPQAWSPVSDVQPQAGSKMRGVRVIAARAIDDLQVRTSRAAGLADDLHEASHDTETQTAR